MRLIDADVLKKCAIPCQIHNGALTDLCVPLYQIENAPTVEYTFEEAFQKTVCENKLYCPSRPQGEWECVGFVNMKYAWCRCSKCHKTTKIYLDSSNEFCCISDIRKKAVACLYCGADMRKGGVE